MRRRDISIIPIDILVDRWQTVGKILMMINGAMYDNFYIKVYQIDIHV